MKAKILGEIAEENPYSSHSTAAQWAERYIEYQFKYHILLGNSGQIISFANAGEPCGITKNEQRNKEITNLNGNTIPAIEMKKICKDDLAKNEFFAKYLNQERTPMESVTYWFHGTDEGSALDIIMQGIDVEYGKPGLDFSSGAGFYLTR